MEKEKDKRYVSLKEMMDDLLVLRKRSPVHNEQAKKKSAGNKYLIPALVAALILVVVIVILQFTGVQDTDKQMAEMLIEQAMNELNNGQITLQRAIELDPENATAWNRLSVIHIRQGNLAGAISESRRSIELDDSNARAYYNLAYAFDENGQPEEAEIYYSRAVEKDSLLIPAYSALAYLYIRRDQPEQALHLLQQAEALTPDSKYTYLISKNMGWAYYKLNNYKRAIEKLQQSISEQPVEVAETYYLLALCLAKMGEVGQSETAFNNYLRLEQDPEKIAVIQEELKQIKP
jgi:tetratricopeptide (TPR) repeat protein